MNIYAIEGHKVKVTEDTAGSGYSSDQNKVKEHLEIGKEYTVLYTVVENWKTTVKLKEVPRVFFNSCNFEDVTEQSSEDDELHEDWRRYNGP